MKIKIGRNDVCPCGSGLKYKKCCMEKDKTEKNLVSDTKSISDEKRRMVWGTNVFSSGSTFFKSKEDIFDSIKSEGFTPQVEWEDTHEIEGEIFTYGSWISLSSWSC